jgi:hypothetical protein
MLHNCPRAHAHSSASSHQPSAHAGERARMEQHMMEEAHKLSHAQVEIAQTLSAAQIAEFREAFDMFDLDKGGDIDASEYRSHGR